MRTLELTYSEKELSQLSGKIATHEVLLVALSQGEQYARRVGFPAETATWMASMNGDIITVRMEEE